LGVRRDYVSPLIGFSCSGKCQMKMVALKRAVGIRFEHSSLGASVLGHGFRALRDSVLGKLPWKQKPDGRLDFARRDGRSLVVVSQTGGLSSDALEDVVHERVHDRHGFAADTGVRVDLLQHLVDVGRIGFLPLLLPFLVTSASGRLLARLFCSFSRSLGRHFCLHG